MNFSEALELLKQGKKVRRKDWGKTTKIFIRDKQLLMNNGDTEFDYANQYSHWIIDDIFAEDWEVVNEPLLTEEEKEYLRMIIKFHPEEITSILVCFRKDYNLVYFEYKDDADCVVTTKDYFKNLEEERSYTLEELGL